LRMARAGFVVDAGTAARHVRRRLLAQLSDDRCSVPGAAVAIGIVVIEHETIGKVERRPPPIELRRARRCRALRIAEPDGPHAPGTVARTEKGIALDLDALAGDFDPAFVSAVLGE